MMMVRGPCRVVEHNAHIMLRVLRSVDLVVGSAHAKQELVLSIEHPPMNFSSLTAYQQVVQNSQFWIFHGSSLE